MSRCTACDQSLGWTIRIKGEFEEAFSLPLAGAPSVRRPQPALSQSPSVHCDACGAEPDEATRISVISDLWEVLHEAAPESELGRSLTRRTIS
jgi:hypothetical protein